MSWLDRKPALIASAALHLGVAGAAFFAWPASEAKVQTAVPVTIMTEAPSADLRPAVQAEAPQEAAVETPVPDAPAEQPAPVEAPAPEPTPPPPEPTPAPPRPAPPPRPRPEPTPKPTPPAPKPTPPRPTPTPKAAVKPAPVKTAPAKPTAAASPPKAAPSRPAPKPTQVARAEGAGLDLDALASDLAGSAPSGSRRSSAPRGPARTETSLQPRASAGSGLAASAVQGVVSRLQRNWNPNCGVQGADQINVRVRIRLNSDGSLDGAPQLPDGQDPSGSSLESVAAARALRAVNAAAPFSELPPDSYEQWREITPRFVGKTACAGR